MKRTWLLRGQHRGLILGLFTLLMFACYAFSPVIQSGDSRLVLYEADSLMKQNNLDLREFGVVVHGWPCYVEHGQLISRYPYGTALVAVPFVALLSTVGEVLGSDPMDRLSRREPRRFEKLVASAIAALAVLYLVLLARELCQRLAPALAVGAAFGLGTSLWSTASRGLWQHGPIVLLTSMGLLFVARAQNRSDWRWAALAGLPIGFAFVVRPTLIIAVVLLGAGLLATRAYRAAVWFMVACMTVIVPSVAFNLHHYGTVINPVYLPGRGPVQSGISPTLFEGLTGTMISPGRGLFVFSPFLLIGLVALAMRARRRSLSMLDVVSLLAVCAVWFGTANTTTWEGGASYGPRYLTDSLPFWAVLVTPAASWLMKLGQQWAFGRRCLAASTCLLVGWSVFVHGHGAVSWATQKWNSEPSIAYLPNDRSRLWDWHDPQFLRGGSAGYKDFYPETPLPAVPPERFCIYDPP